MLEKDLYKPVYDYFTSLGYSVDGEVLNVDVLCLKDDSVVAIELKTSLNYKVFEQAALRQKQIDLVYICIPKPRNLRKASFKNKLYLLKRLGIGLILIDTNKNVVIYSNPIETFNKTRRLTKKNDIIREIKNRSLRNNIGGTNKTKKMTAYKEKSIIVLYTLFESGPTKGSIIAKISGIANSTNIMYKNYYDWFKREDKGIYSVTINGLLALEEYKNEIEILKNLPKK